MTELARGTFTTHRDAEPAADREPRSRGTLAICICCLVLGAAVVLAARQIGEALRYSAVPIGAAGVVARVDRQTGRVIFITAAGHTVGQYPAAGSGTGSEQNP